MLAVATRVRLSMLTAKDRPYNVQEAENAFRGTRNTRQDGLGRPCRPRPFRYILAKRGLSAVCREIPRSRADRQRRLLPRSGIHSLNSGNSEQAGHGLRATTSDLRRQRQQPVQSKNKREKRQIGQRVEKHLSFSPETVRAPCLFVRRATDVHRPGNA